MMGKVSLRNVVNIEGCNSQLFQTEWDYDWGNTDGKATVDAQNIIRSPATEDLTLGFSNDNRIYVQKLWAESSRIRVVGMQ